MWIDAISINQDDIVERGRQVPRMGTIYNNATAIYSYVGETADDFGSVLDFIRELHKHPMLRINNLGEFHFGEWGSTEDGLWYGENKIKPDQLARLCARLYKFLTNQYFRRAWVLQVLCLYGFIPQSADPLIGDRVGLESHYTRIAGALHILRASRKSRVPPSRYVTERSHHGWANSKRRSFARRCRC